MPEPTVPDLPSAAQALVDWIDGSVWTRISELNNLAGPVRAALAAEATEPPAVCPYLVTTDDATSYCSLAASAGPAPGPQGADEPGMRAVKDASGRIADFEWTGAPDEPGDDDVTELRRLMDGASMRNWAVCSGSSWEVRCPGLGQREDVVATFPYKGDPRAENDARFVAAARNALPGLLAEVERQRAAAPASEDDERLRCAGCGLAYGGGAWCDVVIPKEAWLAISPTGHEGGVLCFNCIALRLVEAGLSDIPVKITSGPFDRAAAGSPPPTPGPTPERLFEVLSDALTESGGSHVLGSDVARARNAVMALLSTPATVLCEGNTKTVATSGFERILEDHSWFDCAGGSIILPVPDGTHVVVTRSEP